MTVPDIRGLIFDMDGVIADTDEMHFITWQRLAHEEGIAFSREKYLRMSGVGHEENARIFTDGINVDSETVDDWMARKQLYYAELRDNLEPDDVMPGILKLVAEAREAGFKLGVGSSSRNARPVLERLQLMHLFDVIGDGYTVKNLKPAPDVFLWVAGGMGITPMQCLVLEDAIAGVVAARQAGCYVIGVGDAPLDDAHARLSTLAGISLNDLLELVAS